MKILSISFKNFASYGNKLQTIDFSQNDGLFYLVVGSNGSGKSSISDIVKFGLYGKLGNKRLRDIPNRFNANTYVKVILESNNNIIKIERGLHPNYLKLHINNILYDNSRKVTADEYIENELLGMPFYVFNNIISLSINDFKSFLSMGVNDKRMIIDKIFGLDIINIIKWMVRNDMKKIKDEMTLHDIEISSLDMTVKNSEKELQLLQKKLEENKLNEKEQIVLSIQNFELKINTLTEHLVEFRRKLQKSSEFISSASEIVAENNQSIKEINNKETLYLNNKCPECESDLTTEFHKSLQDALKERKKVAADEISKHQEIINNYKKINTALNSNISNANNQRIEFNTLLASYKEKLTNIENNSSDETTSITNIIKNSKEKIIEVKNKKSTTENKQNFNKILDTIYGENGVKLLAINKILPTLNSEIRKVMVELRLDYKVNFNQAFDAEIQHLGYEVAIAQLSTGERKKIDFAVIIALIRLLKIKYPTINIIFLDEIFSSVDADGVYHILKILKDTVKKLNMNIFVVNHSILPEEMFDTKILVSKSNNFSSLDMIKIS
jgi:DNA repair exonuclease SbcCD ATPase subunit